jgi:glutathione S-transferase
MSSIGIPLQGYPKLKTWCDRIQARPAWQKTQITPEMFEAFKIKMLARFASSAPT